MIHSKSGIDIILLICAILGAYLVAELAWKEIFTYFGF